MATSRVLRVLQRNLRQALRQRQLTEASALLERLRHEDPLSAETRGFELEYLFYSRRWDEAMTLTVQLLGLFPDSARIHYLAGRLCYQQKIYAQALRHFYESERIYDHWHTRRWIGKTHSQLGSLEDAEASLLDLLGHHPEVAIDLAWVYERKAAPDRALGYLETYLNLRPDDGFAKAQRLRLRARTLLPEELVEEVEALRALGEAIPSEVVTLYVERMLGAGRGTEIRRFIGEERAGFDMRTAASLAWVCHRLQAYDLAFRLFLQGLPGHLRDFKYLSALESAAARCARIEELIPHYETYAPEEKRLYGRIQGLQRRLQQPDPGS